MSESVRDKFCQNECCENHAAKKVPVSVKRAGDGVRHLCAACEEAYSWGVQHGKFVQANVDHTQPCFGDEDEGKQAQPITGTPAANQLCPQCGNDTIRIVGQTWYNAGVGRDRDGELVMIDYDYGDPQWSDSNEAACHRCGWSGTVGQLLRPGRGGRL